MMAFFMMQNITGIFLPKGLKAILKSKCCQSLGCLKCIFLFNGVSASLSTQFLSIFDKPGPSFLLAELQMRQVFHGLGFYCECFTSSVYVLPSHDISAEGERECKHLLFIIQFQAYNLIRISNVST